MCKSDLIPDVLAKLRGELQELLDESSMPPRMSRDLRDAVAEAMIDEVRRLCDAAEEVLDDSEDAETDEDAGDADFNWHNRIVPGTSYGPNAYVPDGPDDYQFDNVCESS